MNDDEFDFEEVADEFDFDGALAEIGWNPANVAHELPCSYTIVRRWADGRAGIPKEVCRWLASLAHAHRDRPPPPPDVWKAAAVLNGRQPEDDSALLAEVDNISDQRSAIGIVARRHGETATEIAAIERRLRRKRAKQTGCPFTKAITVSKGAEG